MIHAIAIDDEPLALKILSHHCEKIEDIRLLKTFTNHAEAITYLSQNSVDLIFLDIEMPQQNGIDFYKNLDQKIMVIFTTAYHEYAIEAFNVSAIDYVLKPIGLERFNEAIKKAIRMKEMQAFSNTIETNYILIRADYKINKILLNEIQYIEGLDDYVQIYLDYKPKIVARISMKSILKKLPSDAFIRVHRSYIIPKNRIKSINNKQIGILNMVIPIGETFKNELSDFLKKV